MEIKINAAILKRLREEKSWSQEHLAEAAGLSLRTIQRVESDGNAAPETRMAMASALGVDVAKLNASVGLKTGAPQGLSNDHLRYGFLRHLLIYAAVNAGLILFDLSHSGAVGWSKWPILGWGIGLVFHWIKVRKSFFLIPASKA